MNPQGSRPTSQLFSEIFLTRAEKDNIANWQYKVECPGIASKILNPFYNYIVTFVPKGVSPNVCTPAHFRQLTVIGTLILWVTYVHLCLAKQSQTRLLDV